MATKVRFMNAQDIRKYFSSSVSLDLSGSFQNFACVSVILLQEHNQFNILFIERQINPYDPWSGHIAFPGGKKSINDQHLLDAAIRETKEEIGLNLDHTSVIGQLDDLQGRKSGVLQNFLIRPYLFLIEKNLIPEFQLNHHEVASIHLISLEKLIIKPNIVYFDYNHQGQQVSLPSLPLSKNKIWGLTYLILRNLQEHLIQMKYLDPTQLLPDYTQTTVHR